MASPEIQLRNGRAGDVTRMVQLLTDDRVRHHLGRPRPKSIAWTLAVVSVAGARCGRRRWVQIVSDARSGRMLGTVMVDRRNPNRPGHVRPDGRELELSYVLLPDAWGRGIAEAACRDLLARVASEVRGDEPLLAVTQTSNQKALALAGRLGFVACGEFVEFGSDQQLLTASLTTFDA